FNLYLKKGCIKGETIGTKIGKLDLGIDIPYWFKIPDLTIDTFNPYLVVKISTSFLTSDRVKLSVHNLIPLSLIQVPSSMIQIAKAIGDKYCSIQQGRAFLPLP